MEQRDGTAARKERVLPPMPEVAQPRVAAGWYPDSQMAGTQRYWDGSSWTDHVAPLPAQAPHAAASGAPGGDSGNLTTVGVVLAILFPIAGFVAGAVLLAKRPSAGAGVMILSIFCALVWGGMYFS
jgi:hypothetical protein